MRARRGAVDLIGQQHVGKRGALQKLKLAALLVEDRHAGDVVGQQVGGALEALETDAQAGGQRAGKHRLADAGHILQQHVPIAQQRYQQQLDHIALADDHTLDIIADLAGKGLD